MEPTSFATEVMPARRPRKIVYVSLEGNIGSGKSTLLQHLNHHLPSTDRDHMVFVDEPVEEWSTITDEQGTTILEKFYADKTKYGFPFQMLAYISRVHLLKTAVDRACVEAPPSARIVVIMERSVNTDRHVFAKMLVDAGHIEEVNYRIYLRWFDAFSAQFPLHKIVHVDVCPSVCHDRIARRSRSGESDISLEYLQQCHAYHLAMLDTRLPGCACTNQLILPGNSDMRIQPDLLAVWTDRVREFVHAE